MIRKHRKGGCSHTSRLTAHHTTQGDNNYGDDRLLYARGQEWLHKQHIMGRAVGCALQLWWHLSVCVLLVSLL